MPPRKYPPLTFREVARILEKSGFVLKRVEGSHHHYEGYVKGSRRVVTLVKNISEFDPFLLKSMIAQSGLTREEFYGATKRTARKIR